MVGLRDYEEREGRWEELSVVWILWRGCLELSRGVGTLLTLGSSCVGESGDWELVI